MHQNIENEETIAGEVDVKDVVRAGLWCWAVQYVVTVLCVLLGSAVCCYDGLCVGQCSMLLRWVCLMERGLVIVISLK